jgi:hypothetical protein
MDLQDLTIPGTDGGLSAVCAGGAGVAAGAAAARAP